MIQKCLVLSGTFFAFTSIVIAFSVNTSFALPSNFEKVHANVSNSCPLVELVGKTEIGPFEKTNLCQESDYAGVSSVVGKVYRVVDGDTIHFYVKGKLFSIRMLGMDTPELHFYGQAQPTWGLKARNALLQMVKPGDIIRGEFDRVKCDRFGRMLLHVYKGQTNLNYEQVKNGFAANYCIAPNMKNCEKYAQAYRSAMIDRLGFHSDSCVITPYVWRKAMMNKTMDKKVKDSITGMSVPADQYYKIPVANRIFYPATQD